MPSTLIHPKKKNGDMTDQGFPIDLLAKGHLDLSIIKLKPRGVLGCMEKRSCAWPIPPPRTATLHCEMTLIRH